MYYPERKKNLQEKSGSCYRGEPRHLQRRTDSGEKKKQEGKTKGTES